MSMNKCAPKATTIVRHRLSKARSIVLRTMPPKVKHTLPFFIKKTTKNPIKQSFRVKKADRLMGVIEAKLERQFHIHS